MGFDTFEEHHVNWSAKKHTSVIRKERGTPGTGQRRCQGKNKVQGPDVMPQCGSGEKYLSLRMFSRHQVWICKWGTPKKIPNTLSFGPEMPLRYPYGDGFIFARFRGILMSGLFSGTQKKSALPWGPLWGLNCLRQCCPAAEGCGFSSSQAGKLRSTSRAEIHIVPAANSPSVYPLVVWWHFAMV